MNSDLEKLLTHEYSDDCTTCKAQDVAALSLVPAVAAWETAYELPQYSIALNGAAQLLGAIIADGVARSDVEDALRQLLDEVEEQIREEGLLGGPPQGTA
ncbi:MAG: hypothetical protein VW226_08000 [Rhodospirillaceae bacterium]|jgi:hypothetical protein